MPFTRQVTLSSSSANIGAVIAQTVTGKNQATFTDTIKIITGCTADASTDIITTPSAHGLETGASFRFNWSYTGAGAPLGLPGSASATYYVIKLSGTTLKFATTKNNALAGTAVNVSSSGGAFAIITTALTTTAVPVFSGTGIELLKWICAKQTNRFSGVIVECVITFSDAEEITFQDSQYVLPGIIGSTLSSMEDSITAPSLGTEKSITSIQFAATADGTGLDEWIASGETIATTVEVLYNDPNDNA